MLPIDTLAIGWKKAFSFLLLIFAFAAAQPAFALQNGIVVPASGETVSGVLSVIGTADHPDFLRYELAFLHETDSGADWVVFAEGSEPVQNETLAIWDTTVGRNAGAPVFPDGRYQLRLRVVKRDYNYDEFFVTGLIISNDAPTPTPTPDETAIVLTVTANPGQPNEMQPAETAVFQQATPLPSLTPFPTPTRPALPVNTLDEGAASPPEPDSGGVIGQLETVDSQRFSEAFWGGVKLTFVLFALLALYLLVRSLGRWLWRKVWAGIRQ